MRENSKNMRTPIHRTIKVREYTGLLWAGENSKNKKYKQFSFYNNIFKKHLVDNDEYGFWDIDEI